MAAKFNHSKEVIAYIAKRFPNCFSTSGEAKPLKIGIFQELAETLKDEDKYSKTQIRIALRQYTSSWRYLHALKEGAMRVDLHGNACGELELKHAQHAKETLIESKARETARRKEQNLRRNTSVSVEATAKNLAHSKKDRKLSSSTYKKTTNTKAKELLDTRKKYIKTVEHEQHKKSSTNKALAIDEVQVGRIVHLNMGNGNLKATVVEVSKDDVRVRLENGLQMVVKPNHLLE